MNIPTRERNRISTVDSATTVATRLKTNAAISISRAYGKPLTPAAPIDVNPRATISPTGAA